MAAHIGQPARSRRFIKAYLTTWALLAVGALAYLAVLAFQPQAGAPRQQVADADPSQGVRAIAKTMKEVHTIQGNLSDIRKDVTQLQEAAGEHAARDKVVQSRLAVLEERVGAIDTSQTSAAPAPKVSADKTHRRSFDPVTTAHIIAVSPPDNAQPPSAKLDARPAPIETGSIKSAEQITFGEAVVTPARTTFAVQLAASPSRQGLQQSWGQLVERHGGALAVLQPRIVSPRAEGGQYRLLAGPLPTKADADRVCTEMGVGRNGCFATPYTGAPL